MTEAARRHAAAGFLLVEVVVALAIVTLAFGYGFRSLSESFDRFALDHDAAAALAVAQSTLDRAGFDLPLGQQEEESGTAAGGFAWTIASAPYTAVVPPAATGLIGYVVHVTVAWHARGQVRRLQLSTVRLARRPPA